MKPLPMTPELVELARRLIWFEDPEVAMADPVRFVAYALERATDADMRLLRRHLDETELCAALAAAPPGIIGPRSWAYWNARFGRYPAPPMPRRELP